jgi:hypothetical protein
VKRGAHYIWLSGYVKHLFCTTFPALFALPRQRREGAHYTDAGDAVKRFAKELLPKHEDFFTNKGIAKIKQ